MASTLSILALLLQLSSHLIMGGMAYFLFSHKGIAYRKYVLLAAVYATVQSFTTSTVIYSLYFHQFSLGTAIARVGYGLFDEAITVLVAYKFIIVVHELRARFDADARLGDTLADRETAAEAIASASATSDAQAGQHLMAIRLQTREMKHKAVA